jgi:hypothetical protein
MASGGTTGVGHRQDGASATSVGDYSDAAGGPVVTDGVVDEVGDELFDEPGVAGGRGRRELGSQVEGVVLRRGAPGSEDGFGHVGQVEGLTAIEAGLSSGEGEERVDQLLVLDAGGEHSLVRGPERFDGGGGVGQGDLGNGPLAGQRRA